MVKRGPKRYRQVSFPGETYTSLQSFPSNAYECWVLTLTQTGFAILVLTTFGKTNSFMKFLEQMNTRSGKSFPTCPQHSSSKKKKRKEKKERKKMVVKLLSHLTWKRLQLLTVDLTTLQAINGWLTCLYLLSAQDKHLSLGVLTNTISVSTLHFHKGSRLPLGTQTFVGLKRPPSAAVVMRHHGIQWGVGCWVPSAEERLQSPCSTAGLMRSRCSAHGN